MEVIEDGNIMDRVPILLQRDLEYYQANQTVLSETVCKGVVGGRLDFPRTASFASMKMVFWLEEEFSIAFRHGSGMFVQSEEDDKGDTGVAKTSDPDKFVTLTVKSADLLLEHLHVLVQEALDHADLPVLTATLGAAALLKNSLHCYVQVMEDAGSSDKLTLLQACYKRYITMAEAVGERVLDLHNRVLSLYILQDSGGRPIDDQSHSTPESGSPSVQGWWLYMQAICANGADLAGLDVQHQSRDVRDVHSKCIELFKCMVYRGAELHYIHQIFKIKKDCPEPNVKDHPFPWFTFVSPNLFDGSFDDILVKNTQEFSKKTAIGLELLVLLAQPQPSWSLLVKVLMMRKCHMLRMLLIYNIRHMSKDNSKWPASGLWYSMHGKPGKCKGFLCTADGYCKFKGDDDAADECARTAGALTYVIGTVGCKTEIESSLSYALEVSGREWAACLDKRQVWCDRRPPWLAGVLAMVQSSLHFLPPILVNAIQTGASMYQTMSLCLTCISRTLDCLPQGFKNTTSVLQDCLPSNVNPVGGSVLLQMLITVAYEELLEWARLEVAKEKNKKTLRNARPDGAHALRAAPGYLVHRLCYGIKNKELEVELFMNSVNVDILCLQNISLGKLHHYGGMGRALDLLASYSTHRLQKVDVNNMRSFVSVVRMGVPQGSILGTVQNPSLKNSLSFEAIHESAQFLVSSYDVKRCSDRACAIDRKMIVGRRNVCDNFINFGPYVMYLCLKEYTFECSALFLDISEVNGEPHKHEKSRRAEGKHVRIVALDRTNTSSSVSFDGSQSTPSAIALAIAEALCSIDEDDKHTEELKQLAMLAQKPVTLSNLYGLEDFPDLVGFDIKSDTPATNAERTSDAAALTSQILMSAAGRDSLRVIYDHLQLHSEWLYKELGIQEPAANTAENEISLNKAPLLYIMFHIGRRPFDQYLREEWPMPWSRLVQTAKAWSGVDGARGHVMRRHDVRHKTHKNNKALRELGEIFKTPAQGVL
ncbi:hypothetical protein EVAR_37532_1 [Eumeta japonica]|uniref:Uncharacterized protein n=1 Tax=Eumeta variegata TaxID=151549 RepID=A0A4C1XSC8_EUMVA|nr:hypothetical protein EVAR_37532_1 [Eumeta japonica]